MTSVTLSNGSSLWYSIRNTSSPKAPLVLIQGRGLDHHGWDSVLNEFTNRTIVLLDHRGTGQNTAPLNSEWSTRDFAKDVVTILDHAGIDRAHVYGHSMGGRIAQWLGAEHADRIITLIIGGTSVGDGTGLPRPTTGAATLASGDPSALASFTLLSGSLDRSKSSTSHQRLPRASFTRSNEHPQQGLRPP